MLLFRAQPDVPQHPVSPPFPYDVVLGTTGLLISHLYTQAQTILRLFKPQTNITLVSPLYPTFVVYLTTIYGRLSILSRIQNQPEGILINN